MKPLHFLSLTILLIVLTISAGCRHRGDHWPHTTPHADSIVRELDRAYFLDSLPFAIPLVDSLDAEAARHRHNRSLRLQSLYWKILTHRNPDSTDLWKRQAASLYHRERHPYIAARFDLIDNPEIKKENFMARFQRLLEIYYYFHDHKDTPMQMLASRYLGAFYIKIFDMQKYRDTAHRINQLCQEMGDSTLIVKSTLNLALAEIHVGDSAKAAEMLSGLLSSPRVRNDSNFVGRIYVNIAQSTGNPAYYQKAIDISPAFRNDPANYHTLRLAMLNRFEETGDFAAADSIFDEINLIVAQQGDANARLKLHRVKLRRARQHHDFKTALEEMDSIKALSEQDFSGTQYDQLTREAYQEEMARQQQAAHDRQRIHSLKIIALLVIAAFMILLVTFYYKTRTDRLNLRRAEDKARMAEMEKENLKDKNSLSSMAIAMTERDRLISDLSSITERLSRAGSVSEDAKEALLKRIRLARIDITEWDDFHSAYSKIHPLFLKRVKGAYPDITEGDSRLALYIAAGFSNKQIARIMQLQPDSVKKNRQRLRRRMHIEADDALEETLRQLL